MKNKVNPQIGLSIIQVQSHRCKQTDTFRYPFFII